MEPILVALVALVAAAGIIIAGTRLSLYIFLLQVEATLPYAQRRPVAEERMVPDYTNGVEQQLYYENLDTGSKSARYARNSLLVASIILLVAIMTIISIGAGLVH